MANQNDQQRTILPIPDPPRTGLITSMPGTQISTHRGDAQAERLRYGSARQMHSLACCDG